MISKIPFYHDTKTSDNPLLKFNIYLIFYYFNNKFVNKKKYYIEFNHNLP